MRAWAAVGASVLLATSSAPAHGRPRAAQFRVLGYGAASCGTWLEDRREASFAGLAAESWVQGYLTAFNVYGPSPTRDITVNTDHAGAAAWIDNYCRTHPLADIREAADALIAELLRQQR